MKNLFHLFVGFVFLFLLSWQSAQAQKTQKRDLPLYKDGGKFDFNWSIGIEHEAMRSKLRDFLWTHWSRKKPGRVTAIFYTIEGDPTTTNFYIEPNENENWVIGTESESICCVLDSLMKKKRKPTIRKWKVVYEIVDRIELLNGEMPKPNEVRKIVPTEDTRQPNSYLLRLRQKGDENNNTIFEGFIL